MKVIINSGGLLVAAAIIILIHSSIISKNMRNMEVHNGLESSIDYASDKMIDLYRTLDYQEINSDEYKNQLAECFCNALNNAISTDGEVIVSIIELDMESGSFDFVVEEKYSYGFMNLTGNVASRRAVRFVN